MGTASEAVVQATPEAEVCQWTTLVFNGYYDFVYAPTNFRRLEIFGYCFVNFVSHAAASFAMRALRDFCWQRLGGAKMEVLWSEPHQGLQVHIERYRNSPVMHRGVPLEYKPMLLSRGVQIPFPKPTQV